MNNREIDNFLIDDTIFKNVINEDVALLLKEFDRIMHTGNKSDEEILILAKNSFLLNSVRDVDKTIDDLIKVIKIKKIYPELCMVYNPDGDSFCSLKDVKICLSSRYNVFAFNHELEHLLHYAYQEGKIPEEFDDFLPDFVIENLMKYLAKELQKVIESKLENEDYYKNKYEEFLLISKKNFTEEEKKQYYVKFKEECIKHDVPEFLGFQDILDAYAMGHLEEYYKKNGNMYHLCTHGIEYYSKSKKIRFAEIYANYVALIKSPNGNEYIELLSEILGDEFIHILNNFYNENEKVK